MEVLHGLPSRRSSNKLSEKRLTPYPKKADNLAVRATGVDFLSLCLDAKNMNYDFNLFDFVMNNTDGFPLLQK